MKKTFLCLAAACGLLHAGETGLTTVYQPLEASDAGKPRILAVTCKDHYASSGLSKAGLITLANHAPTNSPDGASDINLASRAGIKMSHDGTTGKDPVLSIDCRAAKPEVSGIGLAEIFRASLECLRRAYAGTFADAELEFLIPADMPELEKIAGEFEKHDKAKPFFPAGP